MDIYLAGTNHFDPSVRKELIGWLKQLAKEHGSEPCFVAVELGKQIYTEIAAAREPWKELARKEWPGISDDTLITLADTMGYEGDAHRAIWRDIDPVWLDDSRKLTPEDHEKLKKYADGRQGVYRAHMRGADPVGDPHTALNGLSESLHRNAGNWDDDPRDEAWARELSGRIGKEGCEWAVVIAGDEHLAEHGGNLRDRLGKGKSCKELPPAGYLTRRIIHL